MGWTLAIFLGGGCTDDEAADVDVDWDANDNASVHSDAGGDADVAHPIKPVTTINGRFSRKRFPKQTSFGNRIFLKFSKLKKSTSYPKGKSGLF